ncbi:MAG: S9 family peptidase [Pirellulales bacterium]
MMRSTCSACDSNLTPRRRILAIAAWSLLVIVAAASGALSEIVRAEEPQKEKPGKNKPDASLLTFDRVFASGEFGVGHGGGGHGGGVDWNARRGGYVTWEKAADGGGRDLVWHDLASDRTEVIVPALRFVPSGEESPLSVESYEFSADGAKLLIYTNSRRVWRQRTRGDYWVLDIAAGELKKLGGTGGASGTRAVSGARASSLMFATFSPDGLRVAYVRENDIYVEDLRGGGIARLTNDGSPTRINGTFDWVNEEELNLRDGFRWSPDGERIAYWQVDTTGVRAYPLVNNTQGLYPEVKTFPYPKAGERNSAVRVGVVGAAGGKTEWLDVPGDPREHYIAHMEWASEDAVILQQFNRLQNENRVIMVQLPRERANLRYPAPGGIRTAFTETDEAWVDNENTAFRFIDDGRKLVWLSERDGWRRAYAVALADGKAEAITPAGVDAIAIEAVDEDRDVGQGGGWLYYLASPDNATEKYLFRAKLDGSAAERVTPAEQRGTHDYRVSPDAKYAVHSFSTFDTPPVTEIVSLSDHKQVRVLADNEDLKKKLAKLKRSPAEFFRVDVGDGVLLDGWCIKPAKMKKNRRYPVLFYVYGEPAGQTVLNRWMGRNYLWYTMLAQQGYVVMSVDNRGTPAPRGRAWRKCIYRQIGVLASAEQAAATRKLLAERPYLDPERIAIWGWSGGGSMTLNAMFRYPDLYRTGMAVAPVPNQRFYDSIYQERYMGLPGDNADGYYRGSAVNYAQQLKGNLLLVHGTGDDNCHYQGAEALVNALVAHDKQFTMFAYPNRSHSISESRNTTRHLFGMLARYLRETTPPGPRKAKAKEKEKAK